MGGARSTNPCDLIQLAKDATAAGETDVAVTRWRAALDSLGDSAPAYAWLNLSRAYRNTSAFDLAEDVVREGLAKHPRNAQLALELAAIAMARRDFPQAVKRCQAVLDSFGDDAPAHAWLTLVRALRADGAMEAAEAAARDGLAMHPVNMQLAIELADTAMKRKDFPEAVSRWQGVLDSFGDDAPAYAWLNLSRAHYYHQAFDAAEAAAREGLARHSGNVKLAMELADMTMKRRDFPEAAIRWRAVLEKFGDSAPSQAWLNLCRAYYNSRAFDRAEAVAREGLAKHPGDLSLAVEIACMAMNRQDFTEAVTRWRAVLESVGDEASAAIYVNYAISLLVVGELNEAECIIRKAAGKHGNKALLAALNQITEYSASEEFREFPANYVGAGTPRPKLEGENCGLARALLVRFLAAGFEGSVDLIGYCLADCSQQRLRETNWDQSTEHRLPADPS